MLIAEAKKQGKEYGYYFQTVTSGFTYTGEGGSLNSFNVTPLEVFRVFVDGRPDELVRGGGYDRNAFCPCFPISQQPEMSPVFLREFAVRSRDGFP